MSVALSVLEADVRRELSDAAATNNRWSQADLYSFINAAASEFSLRSGVVVTLDESIATVDGTYLYNLPAQCPSVASIIAVYWGDDPIEPTSIYAERRLGNVPHDMTAADRGAPTRYYGVMTVGTTSGGSEQIALFKVPDSAETLHIWYGAEATPMTDAAHTCDIPNAFKYGVIWGACDRATESLEMFSRADRFHKKYVSEIARARAFVESQVSAGLYRRDATSDPTTRQW